MGAARTCPRRKHTGDASALRPRTGVLTSGPPHPASAQFCMEHHGCGGAWASALPCRHAAGLPIRAPTAQPFGSAALFLRPMSLNGRLSNPLPPARRRASAGWPPAATCPRIRCVSAARFPGIARRQTTGQRRPRRHVPRHGPCAAFRESGGHRCQHSQGKRGASAGVGASARPRSPSGMSNDLGLLGRKSRRSGAGEQSSRPPTPLTAADRSRGRGPWAWPRGARAQAPLRTGAVLLPCLESFCI